MDYIQGERFKELADFFYLPLGTKENENYDGLVNTLDYSKVFDGCKIYTHTKYAKQLLEVVKLLGVKVVLITHNSDTNIDATYEIPDNVIKWFSQNVCINHPKVVALPIGLENNRWLQKVNKIKIMEDSLNRSRIAKNILYINHNISTNVKERFHVYKVFEGKEWCTIQKGSNGKDFEGYITNVQRHLFVACPEGNGIDTVRLWETLYMGSIPIVRRSINTLHFKDLPICFVDDWEDVTPKFLINEQTRIANSNYNKEKLTFQYWKTKIENYEN